MKKNEFKELKNFSIKELRSKEMELRQELFSQRLKGTTKPIKNNQHAKKLKRDVERELTCIQLKGSQE